MRVYHRSEAPRSQWAGGITYELAIGGEGASYAERRFLYRVSTAVVSLDAAEFTSLPGYDRWIMPLTGPLALTHGGGEPVLLSPYAAHRFDGAAKTGSRGRADDFNLMLKKGEAEGKLYAVRLGGGEKARIATQKGALLHLVYCAEGEASAEGAGLQPGDYACLQPGETMFEAASGGCALVFALAVLANSNLFLNEILSRSGMIHTAGKGGKTMEDNQFKKTGMTVLGTLTNLVEKAADAIGDAVKEENIEQMAKKGEETFDKVKDFGEDALKKAKEFGGNVVSEVKKAFEDKPLMPEIQKAFHAETGALLKKADALFERIGADADVTEVREGLVRAVRESADKLAEIAGSVKNEQKEDGVSDEEHPVE